MLGKQPARLSEHQYTVADLDRLIDRVRDVQHRFSRRLGDRAKVGAQFAAGRDIEAGKRLVREQDRRVGDKRPRDRHALAHAARQRARIDYASATDAEALEAFQLLCRTESIIPALEPSHAVAAVARIAPTMPKDSIIIVNMCGRGDKDIFSVAQHLGVEL